MNKYDKLSGLAQLAADRDIAKLALHAAEKSRLEQKLQDISKQRRALRELPPPEQAEALKWAIWLEQTEKRTCIQLSETTKKMEHARQLAARSNGKARATDILREKAEFTEKMRRRRKAEREGQPPE